MRDDVKRPFILLGMALLAVCSAGTAFADHGALGTNQRDAWINASLARLAATGYLPVSAKPFDQMTNLEAAENVARASERVLAQAPEIPGLVDPVPGIVAPAAAPAAVAPQAAVTPAAPMAATTPVAAPPADLKYLVEEYRKELAALGVDIEKLQSRLKHRRTLFSKLTAEQAKTLDRTGSEVGVYSRGYVNGYRTIGVGSISHDGDTFMSLMLRSVPVPKVLFETDLRIWYTLGYYFVDPGQRLDLRTITLSSTNKAGVFQAGDFFQRLTPLTLWNSSEVHTLVEPRVLQWRRHDREEIVLMDRGEDWRLRGLRFANEGVALPIPKIDPVLSWNLMGGPVKMATTGDFANYWSAAKLGVGFLDHKFDFDAVGLRLWDDPSSAHVGYINDFPKTWYQVYQVGGLNPRLNLDVANDLKVKADWDGATCKYNDDKNNSDRYYRDWASILRGSVESHGVALSAKAFNVGPNYYNPGSQTLRYTPGATTSVGAPLGYVTSSGYRDTGVIGYRDRFLFTDIARPSFAPYDRLEEAILPYGDATPNRKGFTVGADAKLLAKAWVHPQIWFTSADEIEPNWVRVPQASGVDRILAVDSGLNTATTRTFKGVDAALQLDLAAVLGLKSILGVGGEFKKQSSDLGYAKMDSKTIVGSLDVPPSVVCVPVLVATLVNPKIYEKFNKYFKGLDFNFAVRRIEGSGQEYGLSGTTLAEYAFQPVSTDLGKYALRNYDLTRTELLMGARYQITKTLNVRADWLQRTEKIEDPHAPSTTRNQEWRMMYEASF